MGDDEAGLVGDDTEAHLLKVLPVVGGGFWGAEDLD